MHRIPTPNMMHSLSLLSFLFYIIPLSLSQTSDVVCLPYYQWTTSSQNKTPCEVASSLLALCNGGNFDVLALAEGQHYQGPLTVANANPCMCNTVTFSLMTACGLCQGRSVLRWSEWSANCPSSTFSQFPQPLPPGLRVPAWAYYDVRTTDVFDQFLARDNANATESTAVPVPSTTSSSSSQLPPTTSLTTATSSSATPSPSATPQSSESDTEASPDRKHANLVGGAVVGSLFGAAFIVVGVLFWRWRRRRNAASATLGSDRQLEKGPA